MSAHPHTTDLFSASSFFDHNQNFPNWIQSHASIAASLAGCDRSSQCLGSLQGNTKRITSLPPAWNNNNLGGARPVKVEERVRVKSSAHVSYIVGKQGLKIRHIRQETLTYIQTPVNGEDSIFIIRGPSEQVAKAKLRIINEARNFDSILYNEAMAYRNRETKRLNLFLPARYISLVVGRKGCVIKRIMDESETSIVTPKVNTLNGFKIYGSDQAIHDAVTLITNHIRSTNLVTVEECRDNEVEITLVINDFQ